jgi:hypothetical protein
MFLSVTFKRKSAKPLSLLEPMKLKKNSEVKVSKGNILSFRRGTDEISSGGSKVCHDRYI